MIKFRFFLIFTIAIALWHQVAFASSCVELEQDHIEEIWVESSPVKDQCGTGSCWAHPVSSMIEQRLTQRHHIKATISEEYYLIANIFKQAREEFRTSAWKNEIPREMPKLSEGGEMHFAAALGAIPDSVMQSQVIKTSRQTFWNAKRGLFKQLAATYRKLRKLKSTNTKPAEIEKIIRADLTSLEIKFQNRTADLWQVSPDGAHRFLFEGQWFTPSEFFKKYVSPNGSDSFKTIDRISLRNDHSWNDLFNALETHLKNNETAAVSLYWKPAAEFAWYHKNFKHQQAAHAVEVVGLIKTEGKTTAIRIKNSWGESFGNSGFIDIPVEAFKLGFMRLGYFAQKRLSQKFWVC